MRPIILTEGAFEVVPDTNLLFLIPESMKLKQYKTVNITRESFGVSISKENGGPRISSNRIVQILQFWGILSVRRGALKECFDL